MDLLHIDALRVSFRVEDEDLHVLDGVDLHVTPGEVVGVVGESGCGKSVMAMSVLRLHPEPPARIGGGRILWKGRDLLTLSPAALRRVRGREIAMIFQEPMTSLNPVYTVGDQIAEAVALHRAMGHDEAWDVAVEMLRRVHIADPERRAEDYPHQLSGGMKQRVMIAMALSCDPELLIADEPTTALDVTIQAEILDLLRSLITPSPAASGPGMAAPGAERRPERQMSMVLITHDLGVVAETCDRVVVMYAGRIVESAPAAELFNAPTHPYTRGLLRALPGLLPGRLANIEGMVPHPRDYPTGCRYVARCPHRSPECATRPESTAVSATHAVWCHHPQEGPL